MTRSITRFSIAAVLVAGSVLPAFAHHAFTPEFDATKPVTLQGTITKVEWVNPHAWIYVDVTGADGKVENWSFEMGSPFALLRTGWKRDDIKPGTTVTVSGYRARSGLPVANASVIKLPDGRDLFSPGGPDRPQ
jgi:hypothetical protein